jgi:hypothetical protein
MEGVIELKEVRDYWRVTHNGRVLVSSIGREMAICAAAAHLRPQSEDPAAVAGLQFVGVELAELLRARPLVDPNWRRKGPRIQVELFAQVEAHLRTEPVPADDAALFGEYRAAVLGWNFGQALDYLMQLGERQGCTPPF